ncbi:hypothetical protein TNCV_4645911 [Trichonephila clavipes]|nr:hypothetical protein TNCV_4645911 [Trichonephila clavipes]
MATGSFMSHNYSSSQSEVSRDHYRCNKSNDGCGESNSTVPKNSADEKNCADSAKLCTNETEPSTSEKNC